MKWASSGLPGPPAGAGRDALGARERREDAGQGPRRPRGSAYDVLAVVAAPRLGRDQHVGVQGRRDVDGVGAPPPAVDAGVEVERRDTHRQTLRRARSAVAGSNGGVRQRELRAPASGGSTRSSATPSGAARRSSSCWSVPCADDELQRIAFELGVSETVFVRRVGDGWSLRWFTPTVEVDLGGHATLAALHVLLTELGVPGRRAGLRDPRRAPCRAGDCATACWASTCRGASLEPLDPAVLGDTLGPVSEVYRAGTPERAGGGQGLRRALRTGHRPDEPVPGAGSSW